MADGYVHTLPQNGGWINMIEGGDALDGWFAIKEHAVTAGWLAAQRRQTEHIIHAKDGTVVDDSPRQ